MRKNTLFYCLFIFCNFLVIYAQEPDNFEQLKNLIPVSPNAFEFSKYTKIPVGLFTGTIQYSFPIYEIDNNTIKIPISIDYSSNGLNVDKFESNVGMEWVLKSGGIITRELNDNPDEYCRVVFPEPPYLINDIRLLSLMTDDCADTQPDIFNININGYSGKFFLDINNNPIFIEPTLLKLEIVDDSFNSENLENPDFIIITPDGTKYWMGGNNGSETAFSRVDVVLKGWTSSPTYPAKISWYVSKIETTNNDVINFYYKLNNKTRLTGVQQSGKIINSGFFSPVQRQNPSITKTISNESFLDSIKWNEGKMEFYGSDRIDSIIIKDNSKNTIKKFNLIYTSYNSNSIFKNPDCSYCDVNTIRYFLTHIEQINNLNNDKINFSFEYYSPENLPPRLTYARDKMGYFNGKNNANLFPNSFNFDYGIYSSDASFIFDSAITQYFFKDIGGDRESNPEYGINGMLKKINYPTKGYTEFVYEPNSIFKQIKNYQYSPVNLTVNTITEFNNSNSITIQAIEDQVIQFNTSVSFIPENPETEIFGCGIDSSYYPWDISGYLTVFDNTTNTNIQLINHSIYDIAFDGNIVADSSYNIISNFLKNHSYTITLNLNRPCLRMDLSFNLISGINPEDIYYPVGGMRIKKVTYNDNNGHILSDDYQYCDFDSTNCQGIYTPVMPSISFLTRNEELNLNEIYELNVGSSSMNDLYFTNTYHMIYPTVIKTQNNDSQLGYIKYTFNTNFEDFPIVLIGDSNSSTPFSNCFGNGDLLKEEFYNSYKIKTKEKEFIYDYDLSFENQFVGHSLGVNKIIHWGYVLNIETGEILGFSDLNYFNVNKYYLNIKRRFLQSIIEKEFIATDTIETIENYIYQNPNKLYLSGKLKHNLSLNEDYFTKYYYPIDMSGEPYIDSLISKNMIGIPLKTETYRNGEKLSEQKTEYAQDATTGNLCLPKYIYTKKGDAENPLEKRITYDLYDDRGNLKQYTLENGQPVSIIWGYNQTQPIAKIEGVAYNSLPSSEVLAAITASNADNDRTIDSSGNEDALRQVLKAIQTALPVTAQMTYFTYDPLIGVTSITDPKGDTQYYIYDAFNRLKQVIDKDGNILSENQYHYRGQNLGE